MAPVLLSRGGLTGLVAPVLLEGGGGRGCVTGLVAPELLQGGRGGVTGLVAPVLHNYCPVRQTIIISSSPQQWDPPVKQTRYIGRIWTETIPNHE